MHTTDFLVNINYLANFNKVLNSYEKIFANVAKEVLILAEVLSTDF